MNDHGPLDSRIEGVTLRQLRQIPDERGMVMHMLRADSPAFDVFGEIYFSTIYRGAIKAWHRHKRTTGNYAVPVGEVRIVMFDSRDASPTKGVVQDVVVGRNHYLAVRIPSGIWYGFEGLAAGESLIANCATQPHDPSEIDRLPPLSSEIPWRWTPG